MAPAGQNLGPKGPKFCPAGNQRKNKALSENKGKTKEKQRKKQIFKEKIWKSKGKIKGKSKAERTNRRARPPAKRPHSRKGKTKENHKFFTKNPRIPDIELLPGLKAQTARIFHR